MREMRDQYNRDDREDREDRDNRNHRDHRPLDEGGPHRGTSAAGHMDDAFERPGEWGQEWGQERSQEWAGGRRGSQPYDSGYGGYDPTGSGTGGTWREQEAREGARRGGEPGYGGGYYGDSGRGGQSYNGAQRLYPGDPGYRGDTRGPARPPRRAGPKNYQRTDARICEDLCEQLAHDHRLDVSEVTVDVAAGVVTLGGTVSTRAQKYAIEDIADGVFGVAEVQNNIRVARHGGQGTSPDTVLNLS
ncbi:BON domain-containing protein [Cupriavidus sp. 30B13]|uniref:BON domain-containing protein n=1 Tax=Cupriavidus sp. 30B13 TaxID=3384241 RepID=UPI003B9024E4